MGAIRFKYEHGEPVLESEIPDLTAAINDQVAIMRNWEKQFVFTWKTKFRRDVRYIKLLEEKYGAFADLKSRIESITLRENKQWDGSTEYEVTYSISLKQAFELLEHYGVAITFNAYARIVNEDGREVDWLLFPPQEGEKGYEKYAGVPPAGACFKELAKRVVNPIVDGKRYSDVKCNSFNDISGPMPVQFSGNFRVKREYRSGEIAFWLDFGWLRVAIWHEIMEAAGIAIAAVGLYWPKELKEDLANKSPNNFSHNAMYAHQPTLDESALVPFLYLEYDLDPKLGFGDPPPYGPFEALAYAAEKEAKSLEGSAKSMEDSGNHSQAANYWNDAQQAWLKALEAWQAVKLHPKRDERIKAAQRKLDEVTEREKQARSRTGARALPTWQAKGGGDKIIITYSDWSGGLKAKVKDQNNRVVDELRSSHPSGVIIWGEDKPSGIYFFVADTSSYTVIPRALKAVLVNPYVVVVRPPAPSWEVTVSGNRLTISYKDWVGNFEAQILDYNAKNVTSLRAAGSSGNISWGENADPGTYVIKVNLPNEKPKAVIIIKKLEWSACVKYASTGPYISIIPRQGTTWPQGKGFGFSIHSSSTPSGSKIGYVNVRDGNKSGEVSWGKESGQTFGCCGRFTVWAYAHDPGLQAMLKNHSLCPNWPTVVEIKMPGFKVGNTPAHPAGGSQSPLTLRKGQSVSISYENWPTPFQLEIYAGDYAFCGPNRKPVLLDKRTNPGGSFTWRADLAEGPYSLVAKAYNGALKRIIQITTN